MCYSEEDKQRQREAGTSCKHKLLTTRSIHTWLHAGKWLAKEVRAAIDQKQAMLEIPRGVYRIADEALMITGSEGLTIRGPGAELLAELDGTHARVLDNRDLVFEGARLCALQHCLCTTRGFPLPAGVSSRWLTVSHVSAGLCCK